MRRCVTLLRSIFIFENLLFNYIVCDKAHHTKTKEELYGILCAFICTLTRQFCWIASIERKHLHLSEKTISFNTFKYFLAYRGNFEQHLLSNFSLTADLLSHLKLAREGL